jgi:hypothetical protein
VLVVEGPLEHVDQHADPDNGMRHATPKGLRIADQPVGEQSDQQDREVAP